jgi:DNA polymerase-3 subunit epsilon
VCIGEETAAQHLIRLAGAMARLRLAPWPYKGRIAVREADSYRALTEIHVLDQWRYLGSARTESELAALLEQCKLPAFDLEHYRLLSRYLTKAQSLASDRGGRPEAPAMVCEPPRSDRRVDACAI